MVSVPPASAGSFLRRGFLIRFTHRGQKNFKCRADANRRVNPNPALALLYDAVHRREAKPGALPNSFVVKKWLEDASLRGRIQSRCPYRSRAGECNPLSGIPDDAVRRANLRRPRSTMSSQCRHFGIASRALMARFSTTCSSWLSSARTTTRRQGSCKRKIDHGTEQRRKKIGDVFYNRAHFDPRAPEEPVLRLNARSCWVIPQRDRRFLNRLGIACDAGLDTRPFEAATQRGRE